METTIMVQSWLSGLKQCWCILFGGVGSNPTDCKQLCFYIFFFLLFFFLLFFYVILYYFICWIIKYIVRFLCLFCFENVVFCIFFHFCGKKLLLVLKSVFLLLIFKFTWTLCKQNLIQKHLLWIYRILFGYTFD